MLSKWIAVLCEEIEFQSVRIDTLCATIRMQYRRINELETRCARLRQAMQEQREHFLAEMGGELYPTGDPDEPCRMLYRN